MACKPNKQRNSWSAVRELCVEGKMRIERVGTRGQPADTLTMGGHGSTEWNRLIGILGM